MDKTKTELYDTGRAAQIARKAAEAAAELGQRDRHGVPVIPDTSSRWLSPEGFIRCPKCNGGDPDCDLCVSETPEARIYHHLRTSEQVDLVALYRALDEARQEVRI